MAVPVPPGMTEEIRQERLKEYFAEQKLAEETRKNTSANRNMGGFWTFFGQLVN
jgi:hypothetical protein